MLALNAAVLIRLLSHTREQQLIVLALVIPFVVIVLAVFCQNSRQRAFPEKDQLGEALLFDRAHPTLRERLQIRAFGRQMNGFTPPLASADRKRSAKLRVCDRAGYIETDEEPILVVGLRGPVALRGSRLP